MTEGITDCDIGILTKTKCHLMTYSSNKELYNLKSLPNKDVLNLKYRIDKYYEIENGKICNHHKYLWLDHYSSLMRKCCDPFNKHSKNITTDLRIINLDTCENAMRSLLLRLKPGDKICKTCQSILNGQIESAQINNPPVNQIDLASDSESPDSTEPRRSERLEKHEKMNYTVSESQQSTGSLIASESSVASIYTTLSQEKMIVNKVLNNLNLPSLNEYHFHKTRRLRDAEDIVQDVCKNFSLAFSKAANINVVVPEPVTHNLLEDSTTFGIILKNLQEEFENTKEIIKKIGYLALLPRDWNKTDIQLHFNCTDYMYRKLSHFRKMDDFPANINLHQRKSYSRISNNMNQLISNYYVNDAHTYTCPGMRQYVSTHDKDGKKIHVQKKLLLYTVHELYLKFVDEYTGDEKVPSFSHFMSLKPVECIHAGDPGSHTICVCAQHQNVKLKLYAVSRYLKYRDLLMSAVCDVDNESCMTNKCKKCPGNAGVLNTFENSLEELDINIEEKNIKYKNWVESGTAASLESFEDDSNSFKNELCNDICKLAFHHYVTETQKQYLNNCKNNLAHDTCIILMDFSENYSFIIQQSVQAFYYNNSSATVHPFCLYFKSEENGEIQNVNYCIISDTKDHQAHSVNAFTAKLISVIKEEFGWIKKVIYFSDGAPQQYKNKNHLVNILCHEEDFAIKVESYNFFATSHGKSPCDAIGGILKRKVMRHCIRSPPEGQITNAREMYEYANKESGEIRVLWVPHTDVKNYERKLNKRFADVKTFPQTRINHCFIPVEGKSMIMKITSTSTNSTIVNVK